MKTLREGGVPPDAARALSPDQVKAASIRLLKNLGSDAATHTAYMEKLQDLFTLGYTPTGLFDLIADLGKGADEINKARGARFVLDFAHRVAVPATAGRIVTGFERVEDIAGVGARRYDLMVEEGGQLYRYELKSWAAYPWAFNLELGSNIFCSGVDQFIRDMVRHYGSTPPTNPQSLRWVFKQMLLPNGQPDVARQNQLLAAFKTAVTDKYSRARLRELLKDNRVLPEGE